MTRKNLAYFSISNTPGTTGNLTVSTAVDALHVTLGSGDDAGVFTCRIFEAAVGSEIRTGCTYTHGTTTLTRGTLESSTTGSALNFTSAAKVQIVSSAADYSQFDRLLDLGAARAKGTGTNQTLSSVSTFTRVTCLTEEFDKSGYWDDTNKVYRPTLPGRYLIVGQLSCNGIGDGKRMILRVGVDPAGGASLSSSNAQSFDLFRGYSSVAGGFVGGAGCAVIEADGTASFGLLAWQDSDAAVVVVADSFLCNFHAFYLGPIV